MTSTKSGRFRRSALLLAVAAVGLAACGDAPSETEAVVTDPIEDEPIDEPAVTTATDTTPPATAPITTTVTTAASTTTTAVDADTPEPSPQAYCDTSRDYWIPYGALSFFAADDSVGIGHAFDDLVARIQAPIDAAPNEEARRSAADAQVVLDELRSLLSPVDFDPENIDDVDALTRVEELIVEFQSTREQLGAFLLDGCGFERSDLVGLARDYASAQATQPTLDDADPLPEPGAPPDTSAPSVESTPITDASGTIEVSVPSEWADVSGEPGPNEDRLVASTDRTDFLNSFDVPGMFIEAVDTPAGTGADTYPTVLDTIVENYSANGCELRIEEPYSDPEYTGTEVAMSCVPGFETRVISGTNTSGTRIFVIAMVLEADDSTTRDLIADSFFV